MNARAPNTVCQYCLYCLSSQYRAGSHFCSPAIPRIRNIAVQYTNRTPKPTEIEFCTGSFSAVDTAAFKAVGGFDEGYFMYVEDADLTQKMRTTGKAYLVPQYTAIHAWHRAAHRSLKPFLWQTGSLLRYFHKWGFKF